MKAIVAMGFVLLLFVFGGFFVYRFTWFGLSLRQNSGYFARGHFEKVVTRVRAMPLVPGKEMRFRLDNPDDPATLRVVKPNETFDRGAGEGNVWASITATGNLTVVIETTDLGHAGEYGFAYSDAPLTPHPFGTDWHTLDVPGHLNLVHPNMKIDDHWWKVLYNLD